MEAIRLLHSELYENVASVPSQYGGGQNSLLGMLMPATEYTTVAPGMPFELPIDGPDILVLEGKGAKEMKRLYNLELADFNRALQFKVQIKWLMLQAIPRQYITTLRHPLMQFSNVTPVAILVHVVGTYGRIRAAIWSTT